MKLRITWMILTVLLVLVVGNAGNQRDLAERRCAEILIAQAASTNAVRGSFGCFDKTTQLDLAFHGISTDEGLAKLVGRKNVYFSYVGKLNDGAYVYEENDLKNPHDTRAAMRVFLKRASEAFMAGNFRNAGPDGFLGSAWMEFSGGYDVWQSDTWIVYLNDQGLIDHVR